MSQPREGGSPLVRGIIAGALAGAALAGFNYLSEEASERPGPVLGGELREYPWRMGRVAYHVEGPEEGAPMLLLHGIHAAASNFEFRHQFDFFARRGYRVYAPDLLGFGLSDHPPISYTDELYIALIADFVRDVIAGRAHVIASSLSCAFVVAAAARYPERFDHLVLVEPVGISQFNQKVPLLSDLAYAVMKSPVVGEGLFNFLASPPSIRHFLKEHAYLDRTRVTDELVEYHYSLSHQPNARHAPAAFLSGCLNRDIREEWSRLRAPLLLAWGYQATTVPVQQGTEFLRLNPRAVINGYDARLLPHIEQAEKFNQETQEWLLGRRKD